MNPTDKRLRSLIRWTKSADQIRAAILVGSLATKRAVDRLSDIDLSLFVTEVDHFARQDQWLKDLEPYWLTISRRQGKRLHRQFLFHDGGSVELYFHPLETLQAYQSSLPTFYEPGYRVLVDKDGLTRNLAKPTGQQTAPSPPTPQAFLNHLEDFWRDAFFAVKYLWRGDLWQSKTFDWKMKQHLLKMMGWQAVVCRGEKDVPLENGKRLTEWVDPDVYPDLMAAFGRFYPADSWRALEETVKVYTRLARQVGTGLDVAYPEAWERDFTALVRDLIANPRE